MTVAVKNKTPVVIPAAILRLAGFKRGQDLEVKASGGVVTITPKLTPDDLQDEREIRDSKMRAAMRKGYGEFLAGKTRPIGEFFAERTARARKRAPRLSGA
ncbi:MAG: AbrB/MazE/SpoVT family DNA-binding domain-containing protein [Bryobacteraceae bacterium]|jgi:antitoxin component of MazEF toxin-antitoxin module